MPHLLHKKTVQAYNAITEDFSDTRQHSWPEFELLLPHLKTNQSLLDLGCGNGRLYKFLKKHRENLSYTGLDNSEKLLEIAKKENPSTKFIHGDMLEIPFKDDSFDLVAAIASFHHIPTKKLRLKALSEMHRVLKNKGILFLSVWDLFQPKYRKYIWKSYRKWLTSLGHWEKRDTLIPWGKTGVLRYYHAFTPSEIEKLLVASKFQIIEKHPGNNLVYICQKA